jgi:hypothetical protein
MPVAQPFSPEVTGAPAAICRVCATVVRLDPTSVETLSAHVRQFMDAHHHDGGSDIAIDISDIPDQRASR